jgi:cyclopropane fatty-acyl-phospholipid synthase-like methyltransferase
MNIPDETTRSSIDASRRKYAIATAAATAEVHASDHIFNWLLTNPVFDSPDSAVHYYFTDGKKSAHKVQRLLERFPVDSKRPRLLEFASGYGCVSRHVVNAMPQIELTSCDIHAEAIDFLKANIPGTLQLQSQHKPEDFNPEQKYDYAFALSFFSHMPRRTWSIWLRQLFGALKPGGYLMFTTQGEASRQYHGHPLIPEDGFWFSAQSEQVDLDVDEYGQTIVTPSFVVPEIASIEAARLVGLDLRGWWEHQDLYIIRKER